jgi:AcrR family transcriptional regulator
MAVPTQEFTPNQLGKQEQILRAARAILLAGGPTACTSRAVAEASGMTKGLIHYYFATVDDVVEAAMTDLLAEQFDRLRATAQAHTDPAERFWAVVEDYVALFAEQPGLGLLWFEYWTQQTRAGRLDRVTPVHDGLVALLTELLADVSVGDPARRARAVLSYVIGVLLRAEVHPVPFAELHPEIASLSDVPA